MKLNKKNLEGYILLSLLFISITVSILILKTVFSIIAYSSILAYFLYPFYKKFIIKGIDKNLSAILALGLFISIIFFPIVFFLYYVIMTLLSIIFKYQFYIQNPNLLDEKVTIFLRKSLGINLNISISDYILQFVKIIVTSASKIFYSLPIFIVYFFVVLFITYYLLKYSNKITTSLYKYSMISGTNLNLILSNLKENLNILFKGYFLTGLVQTIAATVGYLILGIPNVIIAIFLTFIFSLIPYVGTPVVWVPITLYFFLIGSKTKAIILFLYGTFVISSIDNFVRPYLMSGKKELSPPIVFLGFIGGTALMGVVGIILGPLILSLTIFLIKMISTRDVSK